MNRTLVRRLATLSLCTFAVLASTGCHRDTSTASEGNVKRTSASLTIGSGGNPALNGGFSGTAIKAGSYIWFTLRCDPKNVPQTVGNVSSCVGGSQKISFSANGTNFDLDVPGGKVVYSSAVGQTQPTTDWDGVQWVTVVPLNYTKTIFITGLSFYVDPALYPTGLPGSIGPVNWTGALSFGGPDNTNPIDLSCKWSAEIYGDKNGDGNPDVDGFTTDYNFLKVKPADGFVDTFDHTDAAGAAHSYKALRMSGGVNETGAVNFDLTTADYGGNSCTPVPTGPCIAPGGLPIPDGEPCNDNDACTVAKCQGGACLTESTTTCGGATDCFQAGACNPVSGICFSAPKPNGTACSDGNSCTTNDVCTNGTCAGTGGGTGVDDNNPCTLDACDVNGNPTHTPTNEGGVCNDNNACTVAGTSTCTNGTCSGGAPLPTIDDGNVCTQDLCDPATGNVTHPATNNGGVCNDNNACTVDGTSTCTNGTCGGGTLLPTIDDGNVCTQDLCDPATGNITHPATNNGGLCDDGNACTVDGTSTCNGGTCSGGAPLPAIDDGNVCTADLCDPTTGNITHPATNNGGVCNDNNACTVDGTSTCNGGACTGGTPIAGISDNDPCTQDLCDPATGNVTHPPGNNGAVCDDGNACTVNGTSTCNGGACVGGTPVTCPAEDQCNNASTCQVDGSCSVRTPKTGASCNDANTCTTGDTCNASGQCVGNPVQNGTACDDDNLCTQTDSCQAGACVGSNPVICVAIDQCHAPGTCAPETGLCSHPANVNGTPCDDGDPCTVNEICQGGTCRKGDPNTCPAPDTCHLAGTCTPGVGCVNPNVANGTPCSDSNQCTTGDVCTDGTCGGNAVQCNTPTAPICDPTNGSCGACTGHNGSNGPRPCPTAPEPACLETGSCVECTITGGNPNANTVRCTGLKPICDDVLKKCVECTVSQHCPNGEICVDDVCVLPDGGVVDAGTDAGNDAGADAGADAGNDAGVDAGTDAGADAGDGGLDAGRDAGDGGDGGDGGGPDAGRTDGGDGGGALDAGTFVDDFSVEGAGCECSSAHIASMTESSNIARMLAALGAVAAFVARRRRTRRQSSDERS